MHRVLLALAALLLVSGGALAQDLPNRPIRMVVPFTPGGGSDIFYRIIAQAASRHLPAGMVVDNKPGANGITGTGEVARAAPDGSVLGQCAFGTCAGNAVLYQLPYDIERDFTFIGMGGHSDLVVVTRRDLPQRTLAEILAEARRAPETLTYASSGVGSSNHMGMALLNQAAGTRMQHVPYRGGSAAINDLLAGRIDIYLDNISAVLPHIRSGALRPIGVPAPGRHRLLPDVPTFAELGYPQIEIRSWGGFMGPARMPPATVAALNRAINASLAEPAVQEQLAALGFEAAPGTPAEFATFVSREIARWRRVVQDAGIKVD
jgi:tripartite-type tricarboxylate transporter receptor subunit TctC